MLSSRFTCPIFPLPEVVFFPQTTLPLHIFEGRYRQMTADALEADGLITVTQLMPGYEKNYDGRPDIYKVATLGRIREHMQHPDGRYNILLDGVARVKIQDEDELEEKEYRLATCELWTEQMPEGSALRMAPTLNILIALAQRITEVEPNLVPWGREIIRAATRPEFLSNLLGATLGRIFQIDAYDRQCLLEETDVGRRLELLSVQLRQILSALLAKQKAMETGEIDKNVFGEDSDSDDDLMV